MTDHKFFKLMKKLIFLLLILGFQSFNAQNSIVNEEKVTIGFLFLDDDVDGTLSGFKFTGSLNFDNLEYSSISGTVASETIDTDNWFRDRHLRNKYFKTDDFPLLKFKSNSITSEGESLIVVGILTIKDISKTVTFKFKKTANLLKGEASINASDYDIFIHDEASRNTLRIKINLPYSSK